MANAAQIRKAQERREARRNAVQKNEQASKDQEKELAALSDRLRGVAKNEDGTVDRGVENDSLDRTQVGLAEPMPTNYQNPSARQMPKGPSNKKIAAQQAAEAQAQRDLEATVNPLDDQPDVHDLSQYAARGEEPPLHVLNAIARRADNTIKDDARIAAQAAGKAAYDALTEHRSNRSPEARHKKIEQAMRDAAAAKSQVGAADPAKK